MTTESIRGDATQNPALKLWVVLARAFNAVAEHDRASVARHGLTPAEFAVLEVLLHKGPMLLSEVQKKILVSSGGITYLVDRLEDRGLVARRPCAEDRRATYAELTPEGRALISRIFPDHQARLERALSGLSASEQHEAAKLLKKLGLRAAELDPDTDA
jgi:MarR family 2-MHQ and catechol resistance regulon transcriptional repressor